MTSNSPADIYAERMGQLSAQLRALRPRSALIGLGRLICFGLALGGGVVAQGGDALGAAVGATAAAAFVLLLLADAALQEQRAALGRRRTFCSDGLTRLAGRAPATAAAGLAWATADHPYALDLDLVGEAGLYPRLGSPSTAAGGQCLAAWLLAPAPAAEVRARQVAVLELAPQHLLREAAMSQAAALGDNLHPDALARWGAAAAPTALLGPTTGGLLAALTSLSTGLIAFAWLRGACGGGPLLAALAWHWTLARLLRAGTQARVAALELPRLALPPLRRLGAALRAAQLQAPLLMQLQGAWGPATEVCLAQLQRRAEALDWAHNLFFAPIAAWLFWTPQVAWQVERWRRRLGPALAAWQEALARWEALLCLATYAFEQPTDVMPELLDTGAVLEARGLAHPLLPAATAVRNDLSLHPDAPLMLISGSNMSGKSTFLRALGLNVALAWAGAPVRAQALTLSPLQIGATLRVQDSLQRGSSRFYAELQRLQQLHRLAAAGPPLLALLDELLAGTNSHDRALGAAAVLRRLLATGALVLATTHDLALTQLVDLPLVNYHFVDALSAHEPYRLRPGVVPASNALALMRQLELTE